MTKTMTNSTTKSATPQKPRTAAKPAQTAATPPVAAKRAAKPVDKKAVSKKVTAKAVAEPMPAAKVKHKLVRDSFTIPKMEYAVLEALKERAANLKRPAKKSELLRAGISALEAMNDKAFLAALSGVPSLKTGRPAKEA